MVFIFLINLNVYCQLLFPAELKIRYNPLQTSIIFIYMQALTIVKHVSLYKLIFNAHQCNKTKIITKPFVPGFPKDNVTEVIFKLSMAMIGWAIVLFTIILYLLSQN